jgi:uncharacterized protein YjgD (DUF1641 family)
MSYFIFLKNSDNLEGTLYKIAENQYDLNNLNINTNDYKIIEDSQTNFENVKYGTKYPIKYNDNTITYVDSSCLFKKNSLDTEITNFKSIIKNFINNNPNHPLLSRWNDYYNQLNSLNLDNITFPLNKSLEQYFNDLGQTSLNPLQIP